MNEETVSEKAKRFVSKYIFLFVILFIGIVYVLTGIFNLGRTDKTVYEIVADGALTFIVSTMIITLMRLQGLKNGGESERVANTEKALGDKVVLLNPHIDRLPEWCININKRDLRNGRAKILAQACMKYDDYFDENGVSKGFNDEIPEKGNPRYKDYKRKLKAYNKAVNFKIREITPTMLTSVSSKVTDPHDFGRDKSEYEKQTGRTQILVKLLFVFVTAYFGVELLAFSWANIIWKALQIVIYIATGLAQYIKSYTYMTDEYRNGLVKKRYYLQNFENDLRKEGIEIKEENPNG